MDHNIQKILHQIRLQWEALFYLKYLIKKKEYIIIDG